VNDEKAFDLTKIEIPTILNNQFEIDSASLNYLASGSRSYKGVVVSSRQPIEITVTTNEDLAYVSQDGKPYDKHLDMEVRVQRMLTELGDFCFENFGKYEKKLGLEADDKEIYVLNESINKGEWISLEEFVENNGGLMNIPLFYKSEAPLYII
jgi:hypothetical protein